MSRRFSRRAEFERSHRLRMEREPLTTLPIEGCQCDACEAVRDDVHGAGRAGELLGLDDQELDADTMNLARRG